MYVCICNAVTEKQVRGAMQDGVTNLLGLQVELGLGSGCGSCQQMASELLAKHRNQSVALPRIYRPRVA